MQSQAGQNIRAVEIFEPLAAAYPVTVHGTELATAPDNLARGYRRDGAHATDRPAAARRGAGGR
ncbi:hypothetical protein AB0J48_18070 [Nocardia salmonicida]|uniref:hypothetical protein n=1 Tax=Nocardia salmonicida TaxID=53431 RepID=UPI003440F8BA